jgi:hypothetical protein
MGTPVDSGHGSCRISEFARWNRIMLEHEREHLSQVMTSSSFMMQWERDLIVHELTDIDYLLQQFEPRLKVP